MRRGGLLVMCLLACGGHPNQPGGPGKPVGSLLVVQIDGLTPELLGSYLAEPGSRTPGRALYRLTGVGAPSGGRLSFSGAAVTEAWTPLPSLPEVSAASLLTGQPPRVHGVRGAADRMGDRDTLHEVVRGMGRATASAGFGPVHADLVADGSDRDNHAKLVAWLAARTQAPGLVTVRYRGPGLAVAAADRPTDALGVVDAMLGELLYGQGKLAAAGAAVIVIGGNGGVALDREAGAVNGELLRRQVPALRKASIELSGGMVRVAGAPAAAAELAAREPVAAVFVRKGADVELYDPDLQRLRALGPIDDAYPRLRERLLGLCDDGDVVALARRGGFDLGEGKAPRVGSGGATVAESRVALIIAAPVIRAGGLRVPAGLATEEVTGAALELFGEDPGRLGVRRGILEKAEAAPASPVLAACWRAADRGEPAAIDRDCTAALGGADRKGTAEALLARAVAAQARGDAAAGLLDAVAWLDPSPRWPAGDTPLRARWSAAHAPAECAPAPQGVLLLGGDAVDGATPAATLRDQARRWGFPSE
ncbi:MAG TPA: hypothetical protein VL172_15070, partial [Kofleriaceae bacterium]|nr:hypothetical protein [Kofleriaceae bacterium]